MPTLCHKNYCRVTTKHIENNIIYVNNPARNKMDDKIYQNQFYFVANAQLFDSSELNEILPMSNTAVNKGHSCCFHIFIQIIGHAN